MRFKNLLLLLCLISLSILLMSCWDREELNDIAIVLAIGLDYVNEEEIEVSVEVELPGSLPSGPNSTGDDQSTFTHSAIGKNIAEAIGNLQNSFSRRLFLPHARVIIIGEKFAREKGINEEIEFINHFPEARIRSKVYVTDMYAKKMLTFVNQLRSSTAETLKKLGDTKTIAEVTVLDITKNLYSQECQVSIPMVSISERRAGNVKGKIQIEQIGTAIFRDSKMVDKVDVEITKGLNWFKGNIYLETVSIRPKEDDKGYISAIIFNGTSKLIPSIVDGKWKITMKVTSEEDIIQNSTKIKLTSLSNVQSIEKQFEEVIEQLLQKTLQKVQQEIKSDVLGFGKVFYEKYPKEWQEKREEWNEFFPQIEVDYEIKVYVRRIGLAD